MFCKDAYINRKHSAADIAMNFTLTWHRVSVLSLITKVHRLITVSFSVHASGTHYSHKNGEGKEENIEEHPWRGICSEIKTSQITSATAN